jgi:glucokinase
MPPAQWSPKPSPRNPACAVGLDVGGTKIAGGIVEFPSGNIRIKQIIPTRADRDGREVLSDALALAGYLVAQAVEVGSELAGIGVGVAELVDLEGNVTSGYRIGWRGLPVRASFSRLAPATLEADVRAAALAEAMFGAGRAYNLFVYVTVGTGISYSLVQDGSPYAGARGNAELLASSPLTTTCTRCGTQLHPVLEEIASGPALVARYNELSGRQVKQAEEVMAAVETNDPVAHHVVQAAGEALGASVGFLINILDPEAVIVGGGLGLCGGLYWTSFETSTREHIWADNVRDLPIVPGSLGTDAGFIGAAASVWQSRHASSPAP